MTRGQDFIKSANCTHGHRSAMSNSAWCDLNKGSQTALNKFLKPAVNVAAPFIGMAVSAKTKNPKVGAATTNILKSISGGKILSLTDMHSGAGLRLRVM